MRAIDADALNSIKFHQLPYTHIVPNDVNAESYERGWNDAVDAIIDDAPTIEPERKTGRWIYGEKDWQDGWYCSKCKGFVPWDYDFYGLNNIDFIKDFKTCPFCDSKMISCTGSENMER